jgi:membrane protein
MANLRKKISILSIDIFNHFLAADAFLSASALAYTTIISIVPLMILCIGILSVITPFHIYIKPISNFLFRHFVPSSAETIQHYLELYASQASHLSLTGLFFSIMGAVFLLFNIESAFNTVWCVKKRRHGFNALLLYWAILSLFPPAIASAFAISLFLLTLPYVSSLIGFFSKLFPLLILFPYFLTWCCFTFLYKTLPNSKVHLTHAAIGAGISALIFEILKVSFGFYVTHMTSFNDIYGTVSAVPIFFLWLYLSWLVVILGAVIAYVVSSPNHPI